MLTSADGNDRIETREGRARLDTATGLYHPYLDIKKVPTIGVGTTVYPDGRRVTMNDPPATRAQIDAWFAWGMLQAENAMSKAIHVNVTQNQFDALASLVYNIGEHHFETSTLLARLNAGLITQAADQFLVWDKIIEDGHAIVSAGLAARRADERKQFMGAL